VGSGYERRFRLQNGKWIHSPVANRGQWGQGMDDYGRLFTNSNSDYMRVDLVPNFYPARNRNLIVTNPRDGAPGRGVTLEGLGVLDQATRARVMEDPSPKLRAAAIRLSEPALADGNAVVFERVAKHARDASREVRLQVALSLGETTLPARDTVLADLLRHNSEAPFLVPAVVSGLGGREIAFIERLASDPEWRESRQGFASVFETLAGAASAMERSKG
jgi:hypothetical protein